MLHITLLILKILLFTVLILLGLAIVLLLLLLLVPFRYKVYADKHEKFVAKLKVSYMGFVLCLKADYNEDGLYYRLKTFGGTLMDNRHKMTPEEAREAEKRKQEKEAKKQARKDLKETKKKAKQEIKEIRKQAKLARKNGMSVQNPETGEAEVKADKPEVVFDVKKQDVAWSREASSDKEKILHENISGKGENSDTDNVSDKETAYGEENVTGGEKTSDKEKTSDEDDSLKADAIRFIKNDADLYDIACGIKKLIGGFIDKVAGKIYRIIANGIEKFRSLKDMKDSYMGFIRKENTRLALTVVKFNLISLLKTIGPKKLTGELVYGTGDPATTGEHLGLMSVAYPLYYDKIDVTPDFSKKILEGNLYAKGRIRLGKILVVAVRVMFNKNCRAALSDFKRISGRK